MLFSSCLNHSGREKLIGTSKFYITAKLNSEFSVMTQPWKFGVLEYFFVPLWNEKG